MGVGCVHGVLMFLELGFQIVDAFFHLFHPIFQRGNGAPQKFVLLSSRVVDLALVEGEGENRCFVGGFLAVHTLFHVEMAFGACKAYAAQRGHRTLA